MCTHGGVVASDGVLLSRVMDKRRETGDQRWLAKKSRTSSSLSQSLFLSLSPLSPLLPLSPSTSTPPQPFFSTTYTTRTHHQQLSTPPQSHRIPPAVASVCPLLSSSSPPAAKPPPYPRDFSPQSSLGAPSRLPTASASPATRFVRVPVVDASQLTPIKEPPLARARFALLGRCSRPLQRRSVRSPYPPLPRQRASFHHHHPSSSSCHPCAPHPIKFHDRPRGVHQLRGRVRSQLLL